MPLVENDNWHWCNGYVATKVRRRSVYLHRLITGLPDLSVDHASRDRLDNRASNLRLATQAQQLQNTFKAGRDLPKGVRFSKRPGRRKPYHARIRYGGREHSLGYYATPEEGGEAYARAARREFGEFARTAP